MRARAVRERGACFALLAIRTEVVSGAEMAAHESCLRDQTPYCIVASRDGEASGNCGRRVLGTRDTRDRDREVRTPMAKQQKSLKPKIVIIPGRGVAQTINYLLKDRDELDWLVAVGRNKDGEIFFYDTGGDIIEDLGTLDYLKERIVRAHFGEEPE